MTTASVAYGDHTQAFKLVRASAREIRAAAVRIDNNGWRVTFADGSFIELSKWGNHQAFLSNGWNVTPC